jgi:hypothetical protein
MNKQEAIELLGQYLTPGLLALIVQAFDDAAQIAVAEATKDAPARADKENASGEVWLEDCEYCGGAHTLGTVEQCPLNPNKAPIGDVVAAYRAMEAGLQLLSGQILNLRTELLVVKALVEKDGDEVPQSEQEYEDTRTYMEHHYTGGE